jgi:hypothetical protein
LLPVPVALAHGFAKTARDPPPGTAVSNVEHLDAAHCGGRSGYQSAALAETTLKEREGWRRVISWYTAALATTAPSPTTTTAQRGARMSPAA